MDRKINKTILLFWLFTAVFINHRYAGCAEITRTAGSANSILNASSMFTSEDGIVYDTSGTDGISGYKVVSYIGNNEKIIIPDEYNGYAVTSIADNAFRGNEIIRSVVVGGNVTSIGRGAFSYCGYLKNIDFNGSSIKSIPPGCFEACGSLKNATIPASVKKIDKNAFAFCTSLYQVAIPEQVTKFGKDIFYGCNKNRLTVVTPQNSKAESFALKNSLLVTDTNSTSLSARNLRNIEGGQDRVYIYSAPSKVKWKSLNPGIAKVNNYGKITALKKGMATITASTAGQTLKCSVKVLERNKKNCLKVIYSRYVKKEMTDYEKIYAAHAWLVQNVKYDKTLYKTGTVPAVSHTAEGAFNRGIAVCDGYSKAFIIIMEHYGIKCRMVTGGRHAWNMVKIKNKWYHIDCTYDDPIVNGSFNNKMVFFDFFLKTDREMRATHVWDYSAFPKCNSKKINKNYKTV